VYKVAIYLLITICAGVFILPYFYDVSPYELNPNQILLPPTFEHIMGTDRLGRDIFARVLLGGQTSLIIGFLSALITSLIGLIAGVSSSYFRGYFDKAVVVIIDLFLTFPTFFLLLTLVSYIQADIVVLIIVLSITSWMGMARLIRTQSFQIIQQPYIKILKLSNLSTKKIIFKYFAPLLAPIFLFSFTFGVSNAILLESGLSFLGLGINPPQVSWGSLLSNGKDLLEIAWWISFYPGLFISLVTFSLVQISDHLQQKANNKSIQ
jgi:peptide/nickel transport system permease protein